MRKRPGAPWSGYSACSPQGQRPNHGPEFSVSTFLAESRRLRLVCVLVSTPCVVF